VQLHGPTTQGTSCLLTVLPTSMFVTSSTKLPETRHAQDTILLYNCTPTCMSPRSRVKSYQMTSTQKISYLNPLPQPVKSTSSKQMANWFVKHQQSRRLPRTVSQCLFRELLPLQPRHRSSLLQALSPRSSTDPGFPGAPGGAMNRGATLLHYDFRVVTYTSSTKSLNQFTIRAYLNNASFAPNSSHSKTSHKGPHGR